MVWCVGVLVYAGEKSCGKRQTFCVNVVFHVLLSVHSYMSTVHSYMYTVHSYMSTVHFYMVPWGILNPLTTNVSSPPLLLSSSPPQHRPFIMALASGIIGSLSVRRMMHYLTRFVNYDSLNMVGPIIIKLKIDSLFIPLLTNLVKPTSSKKTLGTTRQVRQSYGYPKLPFAASRPG